MRETRNKASKRGEEEEEVVLVLLEKKGRLFDVAVEQRRTLTDHVLRPSLDFPRPPPYKW